MPPKRASFGDIGDTSTSNDEDVPVVDTPRTAERKGLIGSAMNLIGRMRSPSRDEAPAAPPPPPPPPPAPVERPRAASPVHSEAGWATDDMTTAGRVLGDGARGRRKEAAREAAVARRRAAAGKCPTSLPPPKLNQKRATLEVEKAESARRLGGRRAVSDGPAAAARIHKSGDLAHLTSKPKRSNRTTPTRRTASARRRPPI